MNVTVLSIAMQLGRSDQSEDQCLLDLLIDGKPRLFRTHIQVEVIGGARVVIVSCDEDMIEAFGMHTRLRSQVLKLVSRKYAGERFDLPIELTEA